MQPLSSGSADFLPGEDFYNMPYNLEAEQSVLGSILIDSSCLSEVMQLLTSECFYRQQHRELYTVMLRLFTSGAPVDFVTVLEAANAQGIFESPEQAKVYLAQLGQIVPSIGNVMAYAKIVQEKFYIRSLISVAREIIENSADGSEEAASLLDAAEQRIFEIRQGRDAQGLQKIDELIIAAYDRLQKLSGENKEDFLGVPSGFSGLDRVLTGLNKSDLILVAARPGMGKTSFVLNIAQSVAVRSRKKVAIFSLEMSGEQLVSRLLASEASISSYALRTGTLSPEEWVRLASSADVLSQSAIYIDDSPGMSVAGMKAKLRRLRDVGLVVIDYLQLMTSSGRHGDNRVQEISEITRNLKIMAKELDVPVICCSQLSRGPDARSDHRPMLSDLRESGSIEQDADSVIFLYRDAYYNRESEEQNIAECIVAKNRHGETSTVQLGWDGQFTRFTNLELYRHEP